MIDILEEPVGEVYRSLLGFMSPLCTIFSLTWRDQLNFVEHAEMVERRLSPFLIREERSNSWPGTQLLSSGLAIVRHYRFTSNSIAVLNEAPGLYSWQAPDRPEDLCFYSNKGICVLASIAHEADSYFDNIDASLQGLQQAIPGILLRLSPYK